MNQEDTLAATPVADGKIVCQIDNVRVHIIQAHIEKHHKGEWTIERYQKEFPDEPIMSPMAIEAKERRDRARAQAAEMTAAPELPAVSNFITAAAAAGVAMTPVAFSTRPASFHELFELGSVPSAMNAKGAPITVNVLQGHDPQSQVYLPDVDDRYVFNIEILKNIIIGLELNKRTLLWGFHGTGKTTLLQQACARTRRPFLRKQHTINMQESDVLGQWTVKDGSTIFQPGPLAMAMIHGWTYCADEYDFAMPSVLAVYQPVMEGEPLIISDAPPAFRKIVPHKDFRFVATGNTNGTGDETGLYQGTLLQNAANYSRFSITVEVPYMEAKIEERIIISRTGIEKTDAAKIVKFANDMRKLFREGKISTTISPRELIEAAELGLAYGGLWAVGLTLAFCNRLSRVDKEVCTQYLQRIFGGATA